MSENTITHDNGVIEFLGTPPTTRNVATCGECGRSWDDSVSTSVTPTPSGRCAFESDHAAETYDRCVICGEFIDYCQGHGESEAVQDIYAQHDDGDHVGCSPLACSPDMPAYDTKAEPSESAAHSRGESHSRGEHSLCDASLCDAKAEESESDASVYYVLECEDITPSAVVPSVNRTEWIAYMGIYATDDADALVRARELVATARAQGVTRKFRVTRNLGLVD